MSNEEKFKEQKKRLELGQIKIKALLADGKTQEAMQEMKEMLKISNEMLQKASQTLRKILSKEDIKPKDEIETICHNVFPYCDDKYMN